MRGDRVEFGVLVLVDCTFRAEPGRRRSFVCVGDGTLFGLDDVVGDLGLETGTSSGALGTFMFSSSPLDVSGTSRDGKSVHRSSSSTA